jgi:preprotein translocase subunit YajC
MVSVANAVEEGQVPLRASLEETQRSMAELVSRQLVELSSGLQGIVDTVEAGKAPLGAELEQLSSLVQVSVERVEATVALAQRVNEEQRGQQTRELAERLQQAAALLRDVSIIDFKGDSDTGADGEAA